MIDTLLRVAVSITAVTFIIVTIATVVMVVRATAAKTPDTAASAAIVATAAATSAIAMAAWHMTGLGLAGPRLGLAAINVLTAGAMATYAIRWRAVAVRRREIIYDCLRARADQAQGGPHRHHLRPLGRR